MTLPSEEVNSLKAAKNFLYDLLNPKATPRVPKEIRMRARRIAKHFPPNFHIEDLWKDEIKERG